MRDELDLIDISAEGSRTKEHVAEHKNRQKNILGFPLSSLIIFASDLTSTSKGNKPLQVKPRLAYRKYEFSRLPLIISPQAEA